MTHIPFGIRSLPAILATCLIVLPGLLYAADRASPGRWEFTTTTDGASRVFTNCMSADDASQVNGDSNSGKIAAEKKSAGRCSVESFTAAGSSVAYTLVCGSRRISSTTIFHGDRSDGTLTTTVDGETTTTHVEARRLGACS